MEDEKPPTVLHVEPVKMKRRVSFRDENAGSKIADVYNVESLKQMPVADGRGSSCLKCQLL